MMFAHGANIFYNYYFNYNIYLLLPTFLFVKSQYLFKRRKSYIIQLDALCLSQRCLFIFLLFFST